MKKLFTLIMALTALTATAWAQSEELDESLEFIDLNGNVVPDGSVITVSTIDDQGQMVVPLRVRNAIGEAVAASLYEVIDDIPGGKWQTCCFGNCLVLPATGYSPKTVTDGDYNADIQTEWIPTEGQYATWTATLQIHIFDYSIVTEYGETVAKPTDTLIGYGPKVTVKFVYADPAGISAAETADPEVARYSLSGRRLDGPTKGINLVRLASGKTVKAIVK